MELGENMNDELYFGKITDFHTHPYLTPDENLCMYKEALLLTMDEAVCDIKKCGIGHICGSVLSERRYSLSEGFAPLLDLNRHALELKERLGDFYTPGFHVHPGFVDESLKELELMHRRGERLIGELVPYMHGWKEGGYTYASRELDIILEAAGKYDMIVSFHTMTDWKNETEEMIRRHPNVTFVSAHPGQRNDYYWHIELLDKYKNAYLDLSGTGLFRYGMVALGVEKAGSGKLIFGTDYPITNPHMYVQAIMHERISDEQRSRIFYKNAGKLLGLRQIP